MVGEKPGAPPANLTVCWPNRRSSVTPAGPGRSRPNLPAEGCARRRPGHAVAAVTGVGRHLGAIRLDRAARRAEADRGFPDRRGARHRARRSRGMPSDSWTEWRHNHADQGQTRSPRHREAKRASLCERRVKSLRASSAGAPARWVTRRSRRLQGDYGRTASSGHRLTLADP